MEILSIEDYESRTMEEYGFTGRVDRVFLHLKSFHSVQIPQLAQYTVCTVNSCRSSFESQKFSDE